jgi:hypothetical protein
MKMTKQTLIFVLEHETKGALRYAECDQHGVELPFGKSLVGKMYFRKDRMPHPAPARLVVTVE